MGGAVFNIRAGEDFGKTLAQVLLQETKDRPHELVRYRILLPTRRACRVLRECFLNLSDGKPMLLPQMTPLGDVEEEDLSLMMFGSGGGFLDIPQSISPMKRQLLLAQLIWKMPDFVQGADFALELAADLGVLLDRITTEDLDIRDLHKIVPDDFAAHWQITLKFLNIISEVWPAILQEMNVIDVATRRRMLIHALADHWQNNPPDAPVIAAGSTGSIPATARLLRVIASLPSGRLVLPGLDDVMDDKSWNVITESHPQWGLKTLLHNINVNRDQVKALGDESGESPRRILASELMRPAATTDHWKDFTKNRPLSTLLDGVEYYPCTTQQEEAQIISLMLRETLEQRDKVAALITPDRGLARRVQAECRRWGIELDDSAGKGLTTTQAGLFLILTANAVESGYDPVALLAMLKHPLCRMGYEREIYENLLAQTESVFLRARNPVQGFDDLMARAKNSGNAALENFVTDVFSTVEPLLSLAGKGREHDFPAIMTTHIRMTEQCARCDGASGAENIWKGDDGEAAALFLSELSLHGGLLGAMDYRNYIGVLERLMGKVTVRSPYGSHPRLLLLGQLEARLTCADLIIMGGLNEGTWPASASHDPWMSRQMKKNFGLPADEKSIGLAAHDFVQGFCAKKIVLTRAGRVEGAPTVPSRWLQRLDTVMRSGGSSLETLAIRPLIRWAHEMDTPTEIRPCSRPAPCPPVSVRPAGVSITKIENWVKDPYAIYARYVLNLQKTNPLQRKVDAAFKGDILHKVLDRFVKTYPLDLPDGACARLLSIGQDILHAYPAQKEELKYWWPRFVRMAEWFVAHEKEWRKDAKFLCSEVKGHLDLTTNGRSFRLYGIADRIDRMHGGYALIDYKSGGSYTKGALSSGSLPQLPLEAMIVARGVFGTKSFFGQEDVGHGEAATQKIQNGNTVYMGYWKITGGRKAGELIELRENLDETIRTVEQGLQQFLDTFYGEHPAAFLALPNPANVPHFNDYEHLERVKEWAALDDSESEFAEDAA